MRVVIVGAGLAGLRAARLLTQAGADVAVLEGGQRPGGRVRTVRRGLKGGQYSESGAEWVDDVNVRVLELLDRYGIARLGPGEQWTTIRRWLYRDGRLFSPDELRQADPRLMDELDAFDRVVEAATAGVADPARPDLHPDAAALDARSLADVADEAGLGELARLFRRRDAQGEFAAEPQQVSLLFVAQQRAHHDQTSGGRTVLSHRADGGFGRLAWAMAGEVTDLLHFGEHATAVEQDADGVVVHTDQRVLRADHVVLACSLVPVRSMRIDFPEPLATAVRELGYGTVTKTSVQWPRRRWPNGYATTAGPAQRVYEPTVDQPGQTGILMSYCGGAGGHEWAQLDEGARIARAAGEMAAMHGLDAAPIGGWSRAWSNEPRYGGSYAVYQPGQVTAFWAVLRQPWGRVHLAGEHVATCTGYMEGALESGETVATRLINGG